MLPNVRNYYRLPFMVDELFGKEFNHCDHNYSGSVPAVNIVENNNEFVIEVAAPGMEKNDFKIELNRSLLTISSEKDEKKEVNDEKVLRREFTYSTFKRSFTLPQTVEPEKISATYKEGILLVTIPKKDESKEKLFRQIDIN